MGIIKRMGLLAVLALSMSQAWSDHPGDPADGQVYLLDDGGFEVWDDGGQQWVDPVQFWLSFAERRGGLTWGRASEFPPYDEVTEHDTILIELDSGPCLMEFFHRRWRRARDVQRWGEAFNTFGGCPAVFD